MTTTKKNGVLGGLVYVVTEQRDGTHFVHKLGSTGSDEVAPYVVTDGQCSCKASAFRGECKHLSMVNGTLAGAEVPRYKAEEALDEFLEKIRGEWPRAKVVSLIEYAGGGRVRRAPAIATGVSPEHAAERLTIWGEHQGVLIHLHVFQDDERYQKALRQVRRRDRRGAEKGL